MKEISPELLAEFRSGDIRAFNVLFDSLRMRIFYFVKKQIGDKLGAEEITADTFVKLYRLRNNFESIQKIHAFLFITSKNAAFDFIKQRKLRYKHGVAFEKQVGFKFESPKLFEIDVEAEVLGYIYNAIELLPSRSKQVFKLFYLEDCSIATIGEMMNIKPQTVANLKQAALNTLRMKILEKRPDLFIAFILLSSCYPIFRELLIVCGLKSCMNAVSDLQ